MPVYLIADVTVTDPAWVPSYAADVHRIVEKHGGRYLSRSGRITALEGANTSSLIAILEFPSAEAATGFVNDPAYAPHAAARKAGSVSVFRLIDDTDVAGTIPYLGKG